MHLGSYGFRIYQRWIRGLSCHLLMGASMFVQQQLNPQPADPMQAKVMKFLPIIFHRVHAVLPSRSSPILDGE